MVGDISILHFAVEVRPTSSKRRQQRDKTRLRAAHQCPMSRTDNGLTVEIDDDGIGVMADTNPSGMGLASMTERATELGGWCTNQQSPAGGTWIKAWLPILIEGSAGTHDSRVGERSG